MSDTTVYRLGTLAGHYAVVTAPRISLDGCREALTGRVRFGAGHRSPPTGLHRAAGREIDYVISGRLRVDTASASYEIQAGDVIVANPDEPHATTALEDSEIFFVLIDPTAR